MTEETDLDPMGACLQRASERYNKVIGGRCEFERGVKFITRETRLDRAMPWFRKFIRSRVETEEQAEGTISHFRTEGFGPVQVGILRRDFKEWKPLEKSRVAKRSRAVRKK